MKKLLSAVLISFASFALHAQTPALKSEAAKPGPGGTSRSIIISFGKTNTLRGCKEANGLCFSPNKTKAELAKYQLAADEGKGQAWAEKNGNGKIQIVFDLPEVNLTPETIGKIKLQKKYTFAEDTYLPAEMVTQLYKDAGIKDIPAQMKISKGDYPVTVEGSPSAERRRYKMIIIYDPWGFKYADKGGSISIKIKE